MRIGENRVRAPGARERPAKLLADGRRPGIGRVDVQPRARLLAELGDLGNRIHGGGRGRPGCRDNRGRALDLLRKGIRAHAELVVNRHRPAFEPNEPGRLRHREVRLLGHEHHPARPQLPGRGKSGDRRRRRRVLDVAVKTLGEAEQLAQPVECELLDLRRRRRRAPEHRVHVQCGDEELGEDSGLRAGDGEVAEEARVVPVRDPREDRLVEVAEDRLERLAMLGRRGRKPRAHLARGYR